MKKILNEIFHILKYILLVSAFSFTLIIMIRMNSRLNKDITTLIPTFLPYAVLFVLFCLNIILGRKGVNKNIFYNLTSCLVFVTILIVCYRSVSDKNMVLNGKYGYGVDFNYFSNFISFMKIMLYGLGIANILFMFQKNKEEE